MNDKRDDRPRGPKRPGAGKGFGKGFGGRPGGAGRDERRPRDERAPRDASRTERGDRFEGKPAGAKHAGKFAGKPRPDKGGYSAGERGRERPDRERADGPLGEGRGERPGRERAFTRRDDGRSEARGPREGGERPRGRFGEGPGRTADRSGGARFGKPGFGKPSFGKPGFGKPAGAKGGAFRGDRPRPAPDRDRAFRKPAGEAFDAPREDGLDRVSKIMARAGIASRRDAEAMIEAGRVALNGEAITEPGAVAGPHDVILVDGQPLPAKEKTRLWLYHKPAGLVTTAHDPEGRPTVFDSLPEGLPRVVSVGRLDINTEGLLLLTNDGGLAQVLAHPRTGWLRRYRVRAHGQIDAADLDKLADGVVVDEMHYGPIEARIDRVQGDNIWLTLGLREGKNREVKRVLEHLGLKVNRLIRVSFGPFQLGEMEEGQVEEVRTRVLRDQLGPELTRAAEADFDLPAQEKIREGRNAEWDGGKRAVRSAPVPEREPERPREMLERASGRGTAPARSVWRDAETETTRPHGTKKPRRGEDPAEARREAADRKRVRAGKVESPSGRHVLVERVAGTSGDDAGEARLYRKPKSAGRDDRAPERFDGRGRGGKPGFRDGGPGEGRERREDGRPLRGKNFGDKPAFGKPRGGKPSGGRPFGDRPSGGKPFGGKPFGGKPSGGRPSGGARRPR